MSFQPVLPLTGYAGWRYLSRTAEAQRTAHAASPAQQRETDAFRARIGKIGSADALIGDRALLKVALGAFGLEADLGNKAFLKKVLESNPSEPKALANRLADKRYLEFARTFGFAEAGGPRIRQPGFADRIVAAYERRSFEIAVGEKSEAMRLSLSAERELADLSRRRGSADSLWFSVMGQPPLRKVFETALGLPASFGALDIDKQVEVFREKSERALGVGEIADFRDAGTRENLIRLYLLRSETVSPAAASGNVALSLLAAIPRLGPR
jgi:hypothetical protein